MDKQLKQIPKFANEEQERAFGETHDSTEYLDWNAAKSVVLPNLKLAYHFPSATATPA